MSNNFYSFEGKIDSSIFCWLKIVCGDKLIANLPSMMDERFKIYVEQLRDGHIEKLAETFEPAILEVQDADLFFADPVEMHGDAYLADDMLVMHVAASTYANIPCRICNEPVKVKVGFEGFYHAVPLDEVKGGIYNYHPVLRETLLLEVPPLAECHQGKCPQRKTLQKYLKKESAPGEKEVEDGYQPFADLDLDFEQKKKQ